MEVLAVTALGQIPENSRVTKALRMESRGGEKRAWRRKYPRTEDARLRSGCASVGNDVSRAAASPCGKRARGKNTRAWKLSLLVNEDRGNLCNLCNRSRRERVGGGEKQPRCNFLLRFPVLNAFFDDPRCRFLSSSLHFIFVSRFLSARNDIVLYSLLLFRLNRGATKPQLPRSINPFEKLAE